MASYLHQEMYLQQLAGLIRVQGCENGQPSGPALAIDLKSGSVGTVDASRPLAEESGARRVYGVIGLQQLAAGYALAVVTAVKQVAILRGHPIFQVTGTQVFASEDMHVDDEKYAGLLRYAVAPNGAGRGLYLSYEADVSLTQQGYKKVAADAHLKNASLAERADPRFFFNRQLAKHLTEAKVPGVDAFVVPVIMGSVQQLASVSLGGNSMVSITLIARRSVQRPGVRHWRRGADAKGEVANFVETEQLVELSGAEGGGIVSSFVQIRGSIPLLWSQVPNIKYKPTTRLAPKSAYQPAFDRHIANIVDAYKEIVAVNLANQHGSEGVLSAAFKEEAERYAGKAGGMKLVAFDFHKQCGATRYDRLGLLWNEIRGDFKRFGFYVESRGLSQRQGGVFRVNCIDCLDRTNVVQCVLARHHLESLLNRVGLLGDSGSLSKDHPGLELLFKGMWANHGDDISTQYAGTGALKSGFTRTGVRTKAGLADDGYKSAMRYLLNNFQDGHKQDALDLATGAFLICKDKPSPFKPQPKPLLPFLVMLLAGLIGANNLLSLLMGRQEGPFLSTVVRSIFMPFAFSALMLFLIVKFGKKLVNRPQLRPDLSQPW